jgi:exodeoxyribonuclease V alpha subunit
MKAFDILIDLKADGAFSELDIQFAKFISRLDGGENQQLALAAAMVSNRVQAGHICLNLAESAGTSISAGDSDSKIELPRLPEWLTALEASSVVGKPGEYKPLILDGKSRLYLYRYWNYEKILGDSIINRAALECNNIDSNLLHDGLIRMFPDDGDSETDWQKVAAFIALTRSFCVISGAPGTGKTATVAKIIALLLEQDQSIRFALTAPTGKAAVRLQESIREIKQTLDCPEAIKNLITDSASTIHRLLKPVPDSPYFKFNRDNPLPADVVIVDEASMVDLALMAKLVAALKPRTRLILLGDKDQLSSVEAGAVLNDICGADRKYGFSSRFHELYHDITGETLRLAADDAFNSPMKDCIVRLHRNYRFGIRSGIWAASHSINTGDNREALAILDSDKFSDIRRRPLPGLKNVIASLKDKIIEGYKAYLTASDPAEAIDLFGQFRILCAVREGPYGVVVVNKYIEQILRSARLIEPASPWYIGRPVMVTRNDYGLDLYNGDIGLVLSDPESDNRPRVHFRGPDGALRKISPVRLPEHETVFAMTVHKSQGSEYDRIILILPERDSPVVTRELIYTGLTRAKKTAEIWCNENVLEAGLARNIRRSSGLADRLWEFGYRQ